MPDNKKKQAMSLLFGDAPSRPNPDTEREATETDTGETTTPVAKTTSHQDAKTTMAPPRPPASDKHAGTPIGRKQKPTTKGGGERPAPTPGVTPDPYYQGASRYRRASGEQVKHSVYLDPDVSRAVKVAAALGDDPRGTNVSAIVNQVLQDAGYGE